MTRDVHVIGGGLAGSEAAWQLAQAGVPVVLHEMRPVAADRGAQDRRAGRAGLLQLLPLRRLREQCGRPAARGDAARRLADHALRPTPTSCRPAARWRSTVSGFADAVTRRARGASAGHDRPRGDRRAAAKAEWDSVIVATGPLTSPALAARHAGADRRGRARLLRCHRAHRPSREHRHGRVLVPVALRQGGPGGGDADYINCPLDRAQYEAFVEALLAGEKTEFKDVGSSPRPISRAACPSR